jgi:hypothetical protein
MIHLVKVGSNVMNEILNNGLKSVIVHHTKDFCVGDILLLASYDATSGKFSECFYKVVIEAINNYNALSFGLIDKIAIEFEIDI